MAVDWNLLLNYPNAGQAFNQSFQQGIQTNRENAGRAALGALVQNPNDPQALARLAATDPTVAMQFRTQQAQLLREQLAQHQDNIIKGAEIIRSFQPKDQASYSAALAAAQQAGIDLTGVPQDYRPDYVAGVMHLADAMKPDNANDPKYIPMTAGGGLAQVDPVTGQARVVIAPNTSEATAGAPVAASPPTATGPNGQKIQFNPQSGQWEPMGGATASPSRTFPQQPR